MKEFKIVSVYDNLTEAFLQPTFVPTIEEAKRIFAYQINNIPLWKDNASDYDLYELGTYDSEQGTFISLKHKVCGGRSVLRKETGENDILTIEEARQKSNTERNDLLK